MVWGGGGERRKERNRKDMKNAQRGKEEEKMGGKEIKERIQMDKAEARK
jgi:hypothetical protein